MQNATSQYLSSYFGTQNVCRRNRESVGEYNQQGKHGRVYALDGKAVRGMQKKDDPEGEYLLSVYDVEQGKVMPQVEIGRKENRSPRLLKR